MMPMHARKRREELTLLAIVLQSGGESGGMHVVCCQDSVQAEQGSADVVGHAAMQGSGVTEQRQGARLTRRSAVLALFTNTAPG